VPATGRRVIPVKPDLSYVSCMKRTMAAILTASLALLAAACGGNPLSSGVGGASTARSANSQLLVYVHCMRSHGVPNFPEPNSSGKLPKSALAQLARTNARFQAATHNCAPLLPNGGNGPTQAQVARVRSEGLRFAECMRRHGVPLPDPASTGRIPDPATLGIDQGGPKFQAGNRSCGKYRPPYIPSNAEYDAYARAQGS
jgi:hypothetical protein